jgi:chitinase
VVLTVTDVTQDEPVNGLGDGDTSPDAVLGPASNQVSLRAERSGLGDGRVYHVSFTGSDGTGGTCAGVATVGVPHDQGGHSTAVDSGFFFPSL